MVRAFDRWGDRADAAREMWFASEDSLHRRFISAIPEFFSARSMPVGTPTVGSVRPRCASTALSINSSYTPLSLLSLR